MQVQEQLIADIAREVVTRLRVQLQQSSIAIAGSSSAQDGVFATVDEARRRGRLGSASAR